MAPTGDLVGHSCHHDVCRADVGLQPNVSGGPGCPALPLERLSVSRNRLIQSWAFAYTAEAALTLR